MNLFPFINTGTLYHYAVKITTAEKARETGKRPGLFMQVCYDKQKGNLGGVRFVYKTNA